MDNIAPEPFVKSIVKILDCLENTPKEEMTDYIEGYTAAIKGTYNLVSFNVMKGVDFIPVYEFILSLNSCPNPYVERGNVESMRKETSKGWFSGISDVCDIVETLSIVTRKPEVYGYVV